jgi:hypothetical protein
MNAKRLVLVAGLVGLAGCVPLPPPGAVVVAVAPGPGFFWIGGYWAWGGSEYYWVPGRWEAVPHPRAVWVPGRWRGARRGWYWVPGHWR